VLTVPERVLLFCVASGTDWQKAGVTGELDRSDMSIMMSMPSNKAIRTRSGQKFHYVIL
jgi:hypothetical protein